MINKVICKVLSNRLKKVLGSVISSNQTAFLGERNIIDGPLILNEVMPWARKKNKKMFAFKIDFEKAYDNVNWKFLISVMEWMGFLSKWCKWIYGILESARAVVLVNGSPTFEFQCHKGLKIHFGKSSLYGVGVDNSELVEMAKVVNCEAGRFPFTYLGVTIGANMNRLANWRFLFDIFEARLSRWKASSLSLAGRVTIIKSVMECIPTYFFSIFKAPAGVIEGLESIMRKFLWGSSEDGRKVHWVSWDKVASPRNRGGLGISKLKETNVALLSKWVWRFKAKTNSLWRRVIAAIHDTKRGWSIVPYNKYIPGINGPDRWVWLGWDVGVLTVKGVKDFLRSNVDYGDSYVFKWCKWVPRKCNLFMWRALLYRIPTMKALSDWKCIHAGSTVLDCVFCGESMETVDHRFCECVVAAKVWHMVQGWCKTDPFFVFKLKDLMDIHERSRKSKEEKEALKGIILIGCWSIWKARNEIKFENASLNINNLLQGIRSIGCIHTLPSDPLSPDFTKEADDMRALLLRGYEVIGALIVGAATYSNVNACGRDAIDTSSR
uniref:uncharacterized protein LOC122610385 n=1 Tax=Erigeron canadensis TaxID=72917 RepID=UPI001CB8AEC7|nr:uncharacterized protein LOC122610385 [Erigeron canadensis]